MELDFIDISKADEQERAHMPGAVQQSKSNKKFNKSIFLDISEDAGGDGLIYESEGVNRAVAGGGSPVTRTEIKTPGKAIVNIDVSRTAEGGKNRSTRRAAEREERRRRDTDTGRERNPAPARRRNPQSSRSPQSNRNSQSGRNAQDGARERKAAQLKAQRERELRRRRRRRQQITAKLTVLVFMVSMVSLLLFVFIKLVKGGPENVETVKNIDAVRTEKAARREVIKTNKTQKPIMEEDFLTVNEYSRPGEKLEKVNNIFVHYTANKGTSAAQNRSYFENLGITGETSASAHFIIGFDGEIVQCIPLEEIAYAVQKRNYDSISIECCYLQENGEFTEATYQSLIRLSAWLLNEYNLAPEDMRRHYDEGGKKCPLYYVENEDAWEQFLKDLRDYIMAGAAWEAGGSN